MTTRIYIVTEAAGNQRRLIRANNKSQAVRHAASSHFKAEVAGQDDLVEMLNAGTKIELASQGDNAEAAEAV